MFIFFFDYLFHYIKIDSQEKQEHLLYVFLTIIGHLLFHGTFVISGKHMAYDQNHN